jgi:hypothetical protein
LGKGKSDFMQRTIIVPADMTVANLLAAVTANLLNYGFSQSEIDKGVVLVKAEYLCTDLACLGETSAIDSCSEFRAQVTQAAQTNILHETDGNVIYSMRILSTSDHTGVMAACIMAQQFPANGSILPSRRTVVNKNLPIIYMQVGSSGFAGAVEGCFVLTFEW